VKTLDEILSEAPQWRDRPNREPVPHEDWGKDHWALLLRVENHAVDDHGQIDWNRLTLSRRNWPMLWAARNPWETPPVEDAADQFGLRLKPRRHPDVPEVKKGHCEADALMDLVDHGLVAIEMPPISSSGLSYLRPDGNALNSPNPREPVTGWTEWALMPWARFSLTDRGWSVAAELRKHRGRRGAYAEFTMPGELLGTAGS
jgi:hypothetical protein